MIKKLLRVCLLGPLLFVHGSQVHGSQNDGQEIELDKVHKIGTLYEVSLDSPGREKQATISPSLLAKDPIQDEVPLDDPRRENQATIATALLAKDPIQDEGISNTLGFLCGRLQICHTRCYEIEDQPLGCPLHCCSNISYAATVCASGSEIATSLYWQYPTWLGSILGTSITPWIPALIGVGKCLVCSNHAITGMCVYNCADCMDKQEFKRNFKRGLYCAPTDHCSGTNLLRIFKNTYNHCCGES